MLCVMRSNKPVSSRRSSLGKSRLIPLMLLLAATALPASIGHAQTTQSETVAPAPAAPTPAAPTMSRPAAPAAQSAVPATPAPTPPTAPAPTAAPAPENAVPAVPPVAVAPAVAAPVAPAEGANPAAQPPMAVEAPIEQPADLLSQLLNPPRSDLPHDLSPWGMFMAADWVVKAVMLGLAFASLVTWTVWVSKTIELAGARTRATRTLKIIRQSKTLEEAVQAIEARGGPGALMLRTAAEEAELSEEAIDHAGGGGLKERVSSSLSRIEAYAGRRMARGTGVLATIGSTSPFVGLFGTVWGIMNAFIGISESNTTNLAVVAPGIAEALLATAIGLVAAIPAVVIYNVFARSITGYRHLLADVASGVERLVSRDLDYRKVPGHRPRPVSLVAR